MPPDQLRLDGFEKSFYRRIVIEISFAAHRGFEPMLTQQFLIIVRTILASAISVVDAALGWSNSCEVFSLYAPYYLSF